MSDVSPNWLVSIQRLKSQRAGLVANFERQKLENMELEDRIARNAENMTATQEALVALDAQITELEQVHAPETAARVSDRKEG